MTPGLRQSAISNESRRSSVDSNSSVDDLPSVRQWSTKSVPFVEEAVKVLESHQEECRRQFRGWQTDLQRIQQEHVELCAKLAARIIQSSGNSPGGGSVRRVPSESGSLRVRSLALPDGRRQPGEAPRPPGVPGFVPLPPATPAKAAAASEQQTDVPRQTSSKVRLPTKNWSARRAMTQAWAETRAQEAWAENNADAKTSDPSTTSTTASPDAVALTDGSTDPTAKPRMTDHRSTRFGGPIALLYGVERAAGNAQAKSRPTTQEQPKSTTARATMQSIKSIRSTKSSVKKGEGSCLQRFVRSAQVRGVCSTVILANSIFMGVAAQEQLHILLEGGTGLPQEWEHIETGFGIFFMVELFLRLLAEGKSFFMSEDTPWNLFDTFLVLLSTFDIVMSFSGGSGGGVNLSFARTLRIFRFARILRIVRVMRFFYSFRLMVYSVIYSIVSLLWVFVMLLFVIYFFAIFFLHGVAEFLNDIQLDSANQDDKLLQLLTDIRTHYSTVPLCLNSLFKAISGGIDWGDLMDPLTEISPAYGAIFLFYIFFMAFGVLNVVMASFVDSASQISRKDRELVTQNEMERQKQYAANIRRFFHEADVDKTGTLSWEEFERYLQNDKVQAYFQSFELDVSQARTLFKLLDLDESNDVGIDEFVEGCMRMKGPARSIDVNMLLYENEKMIDRQVDFMSFVEEQFQNLDQGGSKLNLPETKRRLSRIRTWAKEREEDKRYARRASVMSNHGEADRHASVTSQLGWLEMDV